MKAEELRLGNIVKVGFLNGAIQEFKSGFQCEVNTGSILIREEIEELKSIPLTEEWLLKFGFEKNAAMQNSKHWFNMIRILDKSDYVDGTYRWQGNENHVILKHVHQLQNLYFALTGTELTPSQTL